MDNEKEQFKLWIVICSLLMISFGGFLSYLIIMAGFFSGPIAIIYYIFYIPTLAFLLYVFVYWGLRLLFWQFKLLFVKNDDKET